MAAFGIEDEYMEELLDILRQLPEIEQAVVYGSRARGDYHRTSDIDLLLYGKKLTDEVVSTLRTKLYYSRIPYLFDLNIFDNLTNPTFISNVKRDGKVLYSR